MDQNQPISPCNGDAISASVRIMARSLQHRRVAWMHDFRDSPTRRSSHSTNPEVERRRPRRDTAPPNFRVFKVNQPVGVFPRFCFVVGASSLGYLRRALPTMEGSAAAVSTYFRRLKTQFYMVDSFFTKRFQTHHWASGCRVGESKTVRGMWRSAAGGIKERRRPDR